MEILDAAQGSPALLVKTPELSLHYMELSRGAPKKKYRWHISPFLPSPFAYGNAMLDRLVYWYARLIALREHAGFLALDKSLKTEGLLI